MDLSFFWDCLRRVAERRKLFFVLLILCFAGVILGFAFIRSPAVYDYHFALVERYLGRVCFSDTNVILLFLGRSAGCGLFLSFILLAGIHPAALVLPPALLLYRAYTFGGSLVILFSTYGVTGALVAAVLYLPVHLATDCIFLAAAVLSCGRAPCFSFSKAGFWAICSDFFVLFLAILLICLFEALLLLIVFHPIGTVI